MVHPFRFLTFVCVCVCVALSSAACSKTPPPEVPPPDPEVHATPTEKPAPEPTPDAAMPPAEPPAPEHKTLFVREMLADCEGESPRKCMQTRSNESEEWSYFYDSIEGFEYEASYRYELRVEVSARQNPPADSSSLRYRLLEVVSKKKIP